MYRILNFAAKYPWLMILLIVMMSAAFYTQLGSLQIRVSTNDLLVRDDPSGIFSQEIDDLFGKSNITLVYLEDEKPLTPKRIQYLQDVIQQLEALPFIDKIDSLFNIPNIKTVDGYLDKEPYLKTIPETIEAAEQLHLEALKNPFLKQVLLSENQKGIAFAITLKDDSNNDNAAHIVNKIDAIILPLKSVYNKVFQVGYPYARTETTKRITQGQLTLLPLAFAALFIALLILLRKIIDLITPMLTAGLSIIWTFGFMSLMDIPLSVITSIIPVLLVVVGSTEDIHLMSEFRAALKKGAKKTSALEIMNKRMGRIVFLTFLTSYAGFLSVSASDIAVLWDFAIVSSTGLLFNFLITILLVPAILSIAGTWGDKKYKNDIMLDWTKGFPDWLENNRRPISLFMVFVTLVFMAAIPSIQVNNNLLDNFDKDSEIRQRFSLMDQQLAGLESFSIIVDSGIDDTFLKVRYLEELVKIQQYITSTEISRSSTSFADYITLLNSAFQELDGPQMPESDEVVDELMIFLSHKDVASYVTDNFSRTRILVRHGDLPAAQLKAFFEQLQNFLDENLDKGLNAKLTGNTILNLSAADAIIYGQLQSILFMLVTIILIISLLFADLKVGLIAAIPNFFPVVILFGFMGFFGIPLNIGTAMAAAIAIGIAVDDTMHFMLRYNNELKNLKHQAQAMRNTIAGEARPVLATSLALIAGFIVFSQSDFAQIRDFGILSALTIGAALVADFIITPLLLSSLHLVTLWDLLSFTVRKEVLNNSELFRGMQPWQIKRFILSSNVLHYFSDAYIFRHGEESNEIYIILEGKVQICLPIDKTHKNIPLETFGPGQMFGEIAVLANQERQTDAKALEPLTLLVFDRKSMKQATRFNSKLSAHLFMNLATSVSKRLISHRANEIKAGSKS